MKPRQLSSLVVGVCFTVVFLFNKLWEAQYTHARFSSERNIRTKTLRNIPTVTSQQKTLYNSTLRFIVTVGLEGTGHHLMGQITLKSPHTQLLTEYNIYPPEVKILHASLWYHQQPETGLWSAHCMDESKENIDDTNLAQLELNVVKQLQKMEQIAREQQQQQQQQNQKSKSPIHVPVNTLNAQDLATFGENSFPNFMGNCRKLAYPSLDLFYRACDKAQVDCGHIYIYRDPMAILKSTMVNRVFEKHIIHQLHLYKTHLNIMAADLITFPDQTWGCFGLLDKPAASSNDTTAAAAADVHPPWWEEMSHLWGWQSLQQFDQDMKQVFKPHGSKSKTATSSDTKSTSASQFVPDHLEPYFYAVQQAHEKAIRICQNVLHSSGDFSIA